MELVLFHLLLESVVPQFDHYLVAICTLSTVVWQVLSEFAAVPKYFNFSILSPYIVIYIPAL
jgi:hypothetical protein